MPTEYVIKKVSGRDPLGRRIQVTHLVPFDPGLGPYIDPETHKPIIPSGHPPPQGSEAADDIIPLPAYGLPLHELHMTEIRGDSMNQMQGLVVGADGQIYRASELAGWSIKKALKKAGKIAAKPVTLQVKAVKYGAKGVAKGAKYAGKAAAWAAKKAAMLAAAPLRRLFAMIVNKRAGQLAAQKAVMAGWNGVGAAKVALSTAEKKEAVKWAANKIKGKLGPLGSTVIAILKYTGTPVSGVGGYQIGFDPASISVTVAAASGGLMSLLKTLQFAEGLRTQVQSVARTVKSLVPAGTPVTILPEINQDLLAMPEGLSPEDELPPEAEEAEESLKGV